MRISQLSNKYCKNTRIYFGNNSSKELKKIIKKKKLLIITSNNGKKRIFKNYSFLKKLNPKYIDDVNNYPSLEYVNKVLNKYEKKKIEIILAYGGGSVLDFAKIVKSYLEIKKKISIKNLIKKINYLKSKEKIELIAIPTTAGTGSEVTNFGTIWDLKNKKKLSLESKIMFPTHAILDAKNTKSLNYINSLYTAIDALNQLFDSFWNKHSNRELKIASAKYIEKSIKNIKKINKKKISLNTRTNLLYSSLISGICIKKTKTSICHSISYPLTSYYNVPHGLAVFFTTSEVFKLVYKRNKKYLKPLIDNTGYKYLNQIISELNEVSSQHQIKKRIKNYIPKFSYIEKIINKMFTKARFKNFILNINRQELNNILIKSYK
tara:strand:- start:57871 stop:59004 length:1134 start_codon:yes stop_codon:yes gene_type:complete